MWNVAGTEGKQTKQQQQQCETSQTKQDSEDEVEARPSIKSHQEAFRNIEDLKMYCLSKGFEDIAEMFDRAQDSLEKLSVKAMSVSKQTTIDTFFTGK